MKLYYSPSACSLAPHIVLREAGLPFTLVKVDTKTHQTEQGVDYYTVNPKGYVPLLELGNGELLSEGPVICQYVSDLAGNTHLMPAAGSMARYRVMEWQSYITSELHKSFGALFNPALDDAAKKVFTDGLLKKFAWVSGQLKGQAYLTGDTFTAADAYLFVVTRWTQFVGMDISACLDLQKFMARVGERPAVAAALQAEG
ncbi:MAG: glutathione transferase GstA [Rubrivivax sp.]|nr:MAG: glutathione transferase GstA [Rubrivivax sp.]